MVKSPKTDKPVNKALERALALTVGPIQSTPLDTAPEDAHAPQLVAANPTLSPVEVALLKMLEQSAETNEQFAAVLQTLKPEPKIVDAITPEYLAKNPVPKLKKPAYQNARPVNPHGLSAATIDKLSKLKPGRYLGGVVTIVEGPDVDKSTHILYKSKSMADRVAMEQRLGGKGFAHMVDLIYDEQASAQ